MGGHPVRPHVINALEAKFRGRRVTTEALLEATNLEREQITAVMLALSKTEGSGVVVVSRGVWDYKVGVPGQRNKAAKPMVTDSIFEVIGRTAEGETLVKGESGIVYKVVPV